VIQVKFTSSGQQISKICNHCRCHIEDLTVEDIMVKKASDMKVFDKDGNEITRTELPNDLKECKCEDCND
jgi:hypothetical protein|tara:strand:+ start:524 stop:733 length:210 start_codon:yes stop_codon:yes gene_type:complete